MSLVHLHYFSSALGQHRSANVLLPDATVKGPFHVLLLLHGLSDDHTIWLRRTSVERYVDGLPLVVVMPDGGRGFYADALEGATFGAAIGEELPRVVEHHFNLHSTSQRPSQWFTSGLSMGGYGAFRLALSYPNRFVSAVSHSGALLFGHRNDAYRDAPYAAEFRRILGEAPKGGPNDLVALVQNAQPRPRLRFDCGVEDFLYGDNIDFHQQLTALGIEHEYEAHPGEHNWAYWDQHVQSGIEFHLRGIGLHK